MKDGLARRVAEEENVTPVFILETMRSLLLDKQTVLQLQRAKPSVLNSFQPIYLGVATLLKAPIQLAKSITSLQQNVQDQEKLLVQVNSKLKSVSKEAIKQLVSEHHQSIERVSVKLRSLETRNGELAREIENPPEKQIAALQSKIKTCDKNIESMSDLTSKLGDDEQNLKRVMEHINANIREREALKRQIDEIRDSKLSDPKVEKKIVIEQMIALKNQIAELRQYTNETLITMHKDKLTSNKALIASHTDKLVQDLNKLQKTPGINNETNDLLKEGIIKIFEANKPKTHQTEKMRTRPLNK